MLDAFSLRLMPGKRNGLSAAHTTFTQEQYQKSYSPLEQGFRYALLKI